jgi:predicted nucleic-acid-binding protein
MTPCDCGDKWWQFAKSLEHIVWHLNDKHKWTREQIAEWVETIEAQQEAKVAEQPEPVHVRP